MAFTVDDWKADFDTCSSTVRNNIIDCVLEFN